MEQKYHTESLLKKHKLRITDCRKDILNLFLENKYALSNALIEEHLSEYFDRVTIYRTLRTFLDKGLVHKVLDDSGSVKFALCMDSCQSEHHHDHVHFKCEVCGKTVCIEKVVIPMVALPAGFMPVEYNLLITGKCSVCNS